jgi:hypothetical protein
MEDDSSNIVSKGINLGICQTACDKVESEVEVGQGEEGEHELNELVQELHMQEDLASESMVCKPDLLEVDEGVNGSEEGTVEPSTSLRDELGDSI